MHAPPSPSAGAAPSAPVPAPCPLFPISFPAQAGIQIHWIQTFRCTQHAQPHTPNTPLPFIHSPQLCPNTNPDICNAPSSLCDHPSVIMDLQDNPRAGRNQLWCRYGCGWVQLSSRSGGQQQWQCPPAQASQQCVRRRSQLGEVVVGGVRLLPPVECHTQSGKSALRGCNPQVSRGWSPKNRWCPLHSAAGSAGAASSSSAARAASASAAASSASAAGAASASASAAGSAAAAWSSCCCTSGWASR